MSYLVLARKYRPKNFAEMVGQSHVVQALGNALTTQRLHHAYLFTGTRGVGKTTISRILAKSLNCLGTDGQGGITATPCGVCQACTDIDSGRFVDYTELDAASNRGVDEIAQLLEQAVYKPVVGRFKVFMIDEVHMLTNTAFNAMLKTLEEPPEYLKFVLATTDPQKVPATVLSRCLQFNLRPMAPETVLEHLGNVLAIENVPAEPQALRLLARAARGSMRDALSLTDQAIAFGSGELLEASVRLMLGSVDRSYVFRLLDALARGDGKTVVETSEALRLHGLSAASTLEEMTTVLQRMAVLQAVPEMMSRAAESASDDDADPEATETARLAQTMPADETQLLYSLCLHGRGELGLAPDEYAALTMVLLRLLAFKPSEARASVAPAPELRSAAEPGKKPQPEPARVVPQAPPAVVVKPNQAQAPVHQARPAIDSIASERSQAEPGTSADLPPPWIEESSPRAFTQPPVAAPVPAPPAVAAPAAQPAPLQSLPSTPAEFVKTPLGDTWSQHVGELVSREVIGALARELALQSELRSQEDGAWTLRVERQSLVQAAACEKLQVAVQNLVNAEPAIRLVVEVGPVTDTPARRNTAAQQERQRQAEEIIHNDPFVQDMMRNWGAKVVPGSIKPTLHANANTGAAVGAKPI
ncbi:DNA polymerase III subunit gamma/tau [Polaromonas sp.]|uniref:DNA polymerase III subunit gamma/tau n=1 Tax=Polaromonas sp. TaxID=1869339 RepID=UPI003BAAB6D1